ncbi:hypothetical protein RJT34_07199 [Clitoria ternatea]|uniref:BED-type domain-containing protein n=1 Tax=Clitoria ternatea TaxID=43366 RepID=A0AAN9PTE9_CLITE
MALTASLAHHAFLKSPTSFYGEASLSLSNSSSSFVASPLTLPRYSSLPGNLSLPRKQFLVFARKITGLEEAMNIRNDRSCEMLQLHCVILNLDCVIQREGQVVTKVKKRPPLRRGRVSPGLPVPDHIPRPPYVGSNILPEIASEYQIHDSEGIAKMRAACELAARVLNFAGTLVRLKAVQGLLMAVQGLFKAVEGTVLKKFHSAMAEENTARAVEGNAAWFRPSPLPGHVKPNAPNQDIAWDWNSLKDINNRKHVICDFCGKTTIGGITRAKRHQMGVRGDCGSCHKCPEEVKETLMAEFINKKNDREAYLKEIDDLDEEHEEVEEILAIQNGKRATSMATLVASSQTASTAKKPNGPLDFFLKAMTPIVKVIQEEEEEVEFDGEDTASEGEEIYLSGDEDDAGDEEPNLEDEDNDEY